ADGLGLSFDPKVRDPRGDPTSLASLEPKALRAKTKAALTQHLVGQHVDKPMHGIYFQNIDSPGLSTRLIFAFLRSAGLRSETEGFFMACQDGVLNTLVYRKRGMHVDVADDSCRTCHRSLETLMHILSACPVLASTAYVHRHNAALQVLYYHLRHSYGIDQ